MNKNKLALLAYPLLLASMGNDLYNVELTTKKLEVKPEWERKLCKSCNNFPKFASFCSSKGTYIKKTSKACCKYEKR